MIRTASILFIAAACCIAAGAQVPRGGLTPAQQRDLFVRNRVMIQVLVDSSLEITDKSGDYVQRSKSYRRVMNEFERELSSAADLNDAKRIAELGRHLDTVIRQGLAPTLRVAQSQIGPAGTGRPELLEIRDRTVDLAAWLQDKARNQWADTPEVRQLIESLERSKQELKSSVDP